ncbi:MAG: MFS transporter [Chloroflexi bacterium]|nr:MFS transporter [Chloroflexota bacterium]
MEAVLTRRARPGWQLAACSSVHVVNDALFAGLYPLLPLVAGDIGLSYAQSGAIKTVYSGISAVFQVPAGIAAERAGEHLLLALGTGWVGVGLIGMAFAAGFVPLLALALAAGLGGNIQHPVATSVVSRLFDSNRRATAIGTLNFAGDIGKVLAPLLVGVVAVGYGWRGGFLALGLAGAVFAALYLLAMPASAAPASAQPPEPAGKRVGARARGRAGARENGQSGKEVPPGSLSLWERARVRAAAAYKRTPDTARVRAAAPPPLGGWGIRRPGLFAVLVVIGMLDSAARGASLTFVPFLLEEKGLDAASMSFYFTALFAAGAAGKFICGPLGDRFGNVAVIAITELVTAGALVALIGVSAGWVLAALLPLGFVLNGTSSVLYASVASLVDASRRARGYGLYYTASQLASALAPIAYGLLADRAGLATTFLTMAGFTALIVPFTLAAGRGLREDPASG